MMAKTLGKVSNEWNHHHQQQQHNNNQNSQQHQHQHQQSQVDINSNQKPLSSADNLPNSNKFNDLSPTYTNSHSTSSLNSSSSKSFYNHENSNILPPTNQLNNSPSLSQLDLYNSPQEFSKKSASNQQQHHHHHFQPLTCSVQKKRHFENSRNKSLKNLGKSAYMNGSQFAVLWVTPSGEVETYASGALQPGLDNWFNMNVMQEARNMSQLEKSNSSLLSPNGKSDSCHCTNQQFPSFDMSTALNGHLQLNTRFISPTCAAEAVQIDLEKFDNPDDQFSNENEGSQVSVITPTAENIPLLNDADWQRSLECVNIDALNASVNQTLKNLQTSHNDSIEDEEDEEGAYTSHERNLQSLQVMIPSKKHTTKSSMLNVPHELNTSVTSPSSLTFDNLTLDLGRNNFNSNQASLSNDDNYVSLPPKTPHTALTLDTTSAKSAPARFNSHSRVHTAPARPGGQSDEISLMRDAPSTKYKYSLESNSTNPKLKSKLPVENLSAIWQIPATNILAYFKIRLMQLQQIMCKGVAKSWIKVIEPKKQSKYPYKDGEFNRPPWWPITARHKEPDHLKKPERITLLLTLLTSPLCTTNLLELSTTDSDESLPAEKSQILLEIYRTNREFERRKRLAPHELNLPYKIEVAEGVLPLEAVGFKISGDGPEFCLTRSGKRKRIPSVIDDDVDNLRLNAQGHWPPQPLFPLEQNFHASKLNVQNSGCRNMVPQSAPPTQSSFNLDVNLHTGQLLRNVPQSHSTFLYKDHSALDHTLYSADLAIDTKQWPKLADAAINQQSINLDLHQELTAFASSLPTPPSSAKASHPAFPFISIQRSYSSPSNAIPQLDQFSSNSNLDINHAFNNSYSIMPAHNAGMPLSPPNSQEC